MKKTMMTLGIFLLAGVLPQSAAADSWCWDSCRWDGCWEVGAEALYWKSCSRDWEYGYISTSTPSELTPLTNKPDYDWGFRVFGGYDSCDGCSFLTLDWAYWRSTNTVTRSAPEGTIITTGSLPNSPATRVRAKLRNRFNRVNLRGGFYLYRGCDLNFYTYAGIRWIDIEEKHNIEVLASSVDSTGTTIKQRSDFWGLGIEIGAGASYHLGCDFHLVGNVGGTTALGESRYKYRQNSVGTDAQPSISASYPTRTVCIPGVDLKIGINYTYDCDCVSLTGEIGYEHMTYFEALVFQQGATGDPGTIICSNFGLGGPYASLKLRF